MSSSTYTIDPEIQTRNFNRMASEFSEKGYTLYDPYQTDGVKWMLERELNTTLISGGILADECGLGKTIQTLATLRANPVSKTLIVAPKCVIHQWLEMAKLLVPNAAVRIHHGIDRPKSLKYYENLFKIKEQTIIISTYGMTVSGRKSRRKGGETSSSLLQEIEWDRVVCDEIHILRNAKTKQSRAIRELNAKIVWGLTGTPVQNSIKDLKTLYECLKFPHHLTMDDRDLYADLNKQYILRRTKDEVVDMVGEIPSLTVNNVEVPFRSTYERKLYQKASDNLMKEMSSGKCDMLAILELYLRLRQTCIHPQVMLDGLANKFELTPEVWGEISTKFQVIGEMMEKHRDEKTLIFCYFKKEMDILESYLADLGWDVFRIDGSKSMDERSEAIEMAKTNSQPTVMIIQIQAGAVGMNLQFASQTYFTSPNWNPSVEIQAIARTHRIGQTRPVTVTKLLIKEDDVIEDKIMETQIIKREIMARVLDDHSLVDNGETVSVV